MNAIIRLFKWTAILLLALVGVYIVYKIAQGMKAAFDAGATAKDAIKRAADYMNPFATQKPGQAAPVTIYSEARDAAGEAIMSAGKLGEGTWLQKINPASDNNIVWQLFGNLGGTAGTTNTLGVAQQPNNISPFLAKDLTAHNQAIGVYSPQPPIDTTSTGDIFGTNYNNAQPATSFKIAPPKPTLGGSALIPDAQMDPWLNGESTTSFMDVVNMNKLPQ